jgi:arsenical pump membrane protein
VIEYRAWAAGVVFLLALTAIIAKPRRVDESVAAALGGLAMVGLGVIGPDQALMALADQWNIFVFFAGLMLISGLADAAGFFDAAGAVAAGAAAGSGRRLLLSVFAAGAVISAFLSNDATALILTPVVYSVVTRLRLPPLPYLFATTFVADTASMTLPVSNPINILVTDRLHLGLGTYTAHLLGASVAAIAVNALVFLVVFRRAVARRFDVDWRAALREAVPDRRLFRLTCAALAVVVAAYLAASALRLPLGPVAAGGAALLGLCALAVRRLDVARVREHVSPTLFLYVAGLLVLVRGVEAPGLTGAVVGRLAGLAADPVGAVAAGLLGAAAAANLINNVPTILVFLSGAASAHLAAPLRLPFVVGALAGADLGPNLTPVGSLSTMLWLVIVRRQGLQLSTVDYLKLGALTTPALLVAAGAVVAATFRL